MNIEYLFLNTVISYKIVLEGQRKQNSTSYRPVRAKGLKIQ